MQLKRKSRVISSCLVVLFSLPQPTYLYGDPDGVKIAFDACHQGKVARCLFHVNVSLPDGRSVSRQVSVSCNERTEIEPSHFFAALHRVMGQEKGWKMAGISRVVGFDADERAIAIAQKEKGSEEVKNSLVQLEEKVGSVHGLVDEKREKLRGEDTREWRRAIDELATIDSTLAVDILSKDMLASGRCRNARECAVEALERLGGTEAAFALRDVVYHDEDETIKDVAKGALIRRISDLPPADAEDYLARSFNVRRVTLERNYRGEVAFPKGPLRIASNLPKESEVKILSEGGYIYQIPGKDLLGRPISHEVHINAEGEGDEWREMTHSYQEDASQKGLVLKDSLGRAVVLEIPHDRSAKIEVSHRKWQSGNGEECRMVTEAGISTQCSRPLDVVTYRVTRQSDQKGFVSETFNLVLGAEERSMNKPIYVQYHEDQGFSVEDDKKAFWLRSSDQQGACYATFGVGSDLTSCNIYAGKGLKVEWLPGPSRHTKWPSEHIFPREHPARDENRRVEMSALELEAGGRFSSLSRNSAHLEDSKNRDFLATVKEEKGAKDLHTIENGKVTYRLQYGDSPSRPWTGEEVSLSSTERTLVHFSDHPSREKLDQMGTFTENKINLPQGLENDIAEIGKADNALDKGLAIGKTVIKGLWELGKKGASYIGSKINGALGYDTPPSSIEVSGVFVTEKSLQNGVVIQKPKEGSGNRFKLMARGDHNMAIGTAEQDVTLRNADVSIEHRRDEKGSVEIRTEAGVRPDPGKSRVTITRREVEGDALRSSTKEFFPHYDDVEKVFVAGEKNSAQEQKGSAELSDEERKKRTIIQTTDYGSGRGKVAQTLEGKVTDAKKPSRSVVRFEMDDLGGRVEGEVTSPGMRTDFKFSGEVDVDTTLAMAGVKVAARVAEVVGSDAPLGSKVGEFFSDATKKLAPHLIFLKDLTGTTRLNSNGMEMEIPIQKGSGTLNWYQQNILFNADTGDERATFQMRGDPRSADGRLIFKAPLAVSGAFDFSDQLQLDIYKARSKSTLSPENQPELSVGDSRFRLHQFELEGGYNIATDDMKFDVSAKIETENDPYRFPLPKEISNYIELNELPIEGRFDIELGARQKQHGLPYFETQVAGGKNKNDSDVQMGFTLLPRGVKLDLRGKAKVEGVGTAQVEEMTLPIDAAGGSEESQRNIPASAKMIVLADGLKVRADDFPGLLKERLDRIHGPVAIEFRDDKGEMELRFATQGEVQSKNDAGESLYRISDLECQIRRSAGGAASCGDGTASDGSQRTVADATTDIRLHGKLSSERFGEYLKLEDARIVYEEGSEKRLKELKLDALLIKSDLMDDETKTLVTTHIEGKRDPGSGTFQLRDSVAKVDIRSAAPGEKVAIDRVGSLRRGAFDVTLEGDFSGRSTSLRHLFGDGERKSSPFDVFNRGSLTVDVSGKYGPLYVDLGGISADYQLNDDILYLDRLYVPGMEWRNDDLYRTKGEGDFLLNGATFDFGNGLMGAHGASIDSPLYRKVNEVDVPILSVINRRYLPYVGRDSKELPEALSRLTFDEDFPNGRTGIMGVITAKVSNGHYLYVNLQSDEAVLYQVDGDSSKLIERETHLKERLPGFGKLSGVYRLNDSNVEKMKEESGTAVPEYVMARDISFYLPQEGGVAASVERISTLYQPTTNLFLSLDLDDFQFAATPDRSLNLGSVRRNVEAGLKRDQEEYDLLFGQLQKISIPADKDAVFRRRYLLAERIYTRSSFLENLTSNTGIHVGNLTGELSEKRRITSLWHDVAGLFGADEEYRVFRDPVSSLSEDGSGDISIPQASFERFIQTAGRKDSDPLDVLSALAGSRGTVRMGDDGLAIQMDPREEDPVTVQNVDRLYSLGLFTEPGALFNGPRLGLLQFVFGGLGNGASYFLGRDNVIAQGAEGLFRLPGIIPDQIPSTGVVPFDALAGGKVSLGLEYEEGEELDQRGPHPIELLGNSRGKSPQESAKGERRTAAFSTLDRMIGTHAPAPAPTWFAHLYPEIYRELHEMHREFLRPADNK